MNGNHISYWSEQEGQLSSTNQTLVSSCHASLSLTNHSLPSTNHVSSSNCHAPLPSNNHATLSSTNHTSISSFHAPLASTWPGPNNYNPGPNTYNPGSGSGWESPTLTANFGWETQSLEYNNRLVDDNKMIDLNLSHQLAAKLLMVPPHTLSQESDTLANPRFKTEICRNFKENGKCQYDDLCQFAHGRNELRLKDRHMNVSQDVVRHNKYKTKLCQKFWIQGYCAYGPRCNFIHNDNERQSHLLGVPAVGGDGRNLVMTAPPPRTYPRSPRPQSRIICGVGDCQRKNSVGESGGDSGSELGCRSLSLSPTGNKAVNYLKPLYGSGRIAAASQQNDIFTWVDTWTHNYL